MNALRTALAFSALLVLPIVAACGGDARENAPPAGASDAKTTPPVPTSGDPCIPAAKGCTCGTAGQVIDCSAKRISGSYVACSPGKQTCGDDKKWSECIGDAVVYDPDAAVPDTGYDAPDTFTWF